MTSLLPDTLSSGADPLGPGAVLGPSVGGATVPIQVTPSSVNEAGAGLAPFPVPLNPMLVAAPEFSDPFVHWLATVYETEHPDAAAEAGNVAAAVAASAKTSAALEANRVRASIDGSKRAAAALGRAVSANRAAEHRPTGEGPTRHPRPLFAQLHKVTLVSDLLTSLVTPDQEARAIGRSLRDTGVLTRSVS